MPLHLIKLCVGCASVEDLVAWRRQEAAAGRGAVCRTRQTPKRAAELEVGGSLYWVMNGAVLCRQAITAVRTVGEGPNSRCEVHLAPEIVRTLPLPRRPFQGWRYLEAADAPADLSASNDGGALPTAVARQLRELGAW